MKNSTKLFFVCLIGILMAACGNSSKFTITATLNGVEDGTMVYLIPSGTHEAQDPIASAPLENGKVTFTGHTSEPIFLAIGLNDSYGNILFFAEGGNRINISATAVKSDRTDLVFYNYADVVITGSPLTDEYKRKMASHEELNNIYVDYHKRNADIVNRIDEARAQGDPELLSKLLETDEYKQFAKEEKEFFEELDRRTKAVILANKDTWWGPFLTLQMFSYLTPEQRPLYEAFSEEARKSRYGQAIKKELYPESHIGRAAPSFEVTDRDGKKIPLKALLEGKKYALIDFWASWCMPCRHEIPNLKEQYGMYAAKGLEIISISTDRKEADWLKALGEENLPWPNFRDIDGSISKDYNVRSIPAIFLVDSNGILIAQDLRGETLAKKLAELFK